MAHFCPRCGGQLKDGFTFCPECGATLDPAPSANVNTANPAEPAPAYTASPAEPLTKQQFLNLPENKKYKTELKTCGLLCYISAALTLVLVVIGSAVSLVPALFYLSGYFLLNSFAITLTVIEMACLAALGVGIHLKQSRVCAILLTIYMVLGWVINLASGGMGSILFTLVAILALTYTFKFNKAWTAYRHSAC